MRHQPFFMRLCPFVVLWALSGMPTDAAAQETVAQAPGQLPYSQYVQECLDVLIEHGTDRYGQVQAPILMNILDVRTRECPQEPVTVNGYGFRIPWLDMFPNAVSIDAPARCREAPSDGAASRYGQH